MTGRLWPIAAFSRRPLSGIETNILGQLMVAGGLHASCSMDLFI
jgi:hypothetical protein